MQPGNLSCPQPTLAAGASETCTGSYTITQADVDVGAVTATSSATALDPGAVAISSNGSTVTVSGTPPSSLSLVASSTSGSFSASGDLLSYRYVVTDTGETTLNGVRVSDDHVLGAAVSCPQSTLAPGASITCTAGYTALQADVDTGAVTSTAAVAAVDPHGVAVSATASSVTVTAAPSASLSLASASSSPGFDQAGDALSLWYLVTNTGTVTLHGVSVSDDHVSPASLSCPQTTLGPGAAMACSGTYTVSQIDADNGSVTTMATVAGVKPSGGSISSTPSTTTVTGAPASSLGLVLSTTAGGFGAAGDSIPLRYQLTNDGATSLHAVTVGDTLSPAGLSCPQSTLAPGDSEACTAPFAVSQFDVDAGSVVDTATATATNPHGGSVTSSPSTLAVSAAPAAALSVAASSTSPPFQQAGDVLSYRYVVSNTGATTVTGATIDDPRIPAAGIACPQSTLAPAASMICTGAYTVTQADVDAGGVTNTATAVGTSPHGVAISSAGSSVTVTSTPIASLGLATTPLTPSYANVGDVLAFRYVVTDTGATTLHALALADDHVAGVDLSCPTTILAPGASTICTGTYSVTQADIDAGSVTTSSSAWALSAGGQSVSSPVRQSSVSSRSAAALTLVATSTSSGFAAAGDQLAYQYVVTNTGDSAALQSIVLIDDHVAPADISCPDSTLAAGATETCTGSYRVTQADVDAGLVTSHVTVTAHTGSGATVAPANSTVSVTGAPTASLGLAASSTSAGFGAAGDQLGFRYAVTNTGATTIHSIAVGDLSCPQSTLPPGVVETCTETHTVTAGDADAGSVTSTGRATGLDPHGVAVVSAPSSVTVTGSPVVTVSLVVSALSPRFAAAGDVLAYRYLATNTGAVTLHGLSVSDDHVGAVDLSCPAGTLAPGASMSCTGTYVVTQADVDAGSLTTSAILSALSPAGIAVDSSRTSVTVSNAATSGLSTVLSATGSGYAHAGTAIALEYTVIDTGQTTLRALWVSDDHVSREAILCPKTTLAPHQQMTCTSTYTVDQSDVDAGSVTDTAVATGANLPHQTVTSAAGSVTVHGVQAPSLRLKARTSATRLGRPGTRIAFTYAVTDTGNTTLDAVAVGVAVKHFGKITCPSRILVPGRQMICTGTHRITAGDWAAKRVSLVVRAVARDPQNRPVSSPIGSLTFTPRGVK